MSKNRFIIISRSPSVVDQNRLTGFLKGRSWGYWHWMNNCWLVATGAKITLKELSNAIHETVPSLRFIVFEAKGEEKHGFGPKGWWEWFKGNWSEEE